MSIEEAIENAQQKVANAYTAVENKGGTLPATQNLSNLPTAINTISTAGTVETLNVTPTTSAQTFTASGGVDGYSPVTVSAVTSDIDSDIVATNIKSGVTILGVTGSVTELAGETRTVSITSTSGNTFTPSSGKNGITSIKVTPTNKTLSITPSTSSQTKTVPSGYSGYGTVSVSAVTSSIDSDIKATNIKSGVNILGVTGSVTELAGETRSVSLTNPAGQTFTPSNGKNGITSITVTPNNQARSVTPTTSQQSLTVNSGYSGNGTITVNAVTSAIDSNIQAGNIKSGVTILGTTGNYTGTTPTLITKNITQNGTYNASSDNADGYSSVTVNVSGGGGGSSRLFKANFWVDTSGRVHNIGLDANNTNLNANGGILSYSADTINTDYAYTDETNFVGVYEYNSYVSKIDLSNLISISGQQAFSLTFKDCSNLTNVDLSNLTVIDAKGAMKRIFYQCNNLTNIDLSSINILSAAGIFGEAFAYCTSLTTLSFPVLKSTSFGRYTNQFNKMLLGVTGCTVHFPSNLQSVIGSWRDVIQGFGGTSTTVLFDLPATT